MITKEKHTQNKANTQQKSRSQKQETRQKNNQQLKQVGFEEGDVRKDCFKETSKR